MTIIYLCLDVPLYHDNWLGRGIKASWIKYDWRNLWILNHVVSGTFADHDQDPDLHYLWWVNFIILIKHGFGYVLSKTLNGALGSTHELWQSMLISSYKWNFIIGYHESFDNHYFGLCWTSYKRKFDVWPAILVVQTPTSPSWIYSVSLAA